MLVRAVLVCVMLTSCAWADTLAEYDRKLAGDLVAAAGGRVKLAWFGATAGAASPQKGLIVFDTDRPASRVLVADDTKQPLVPWITADGATVLYQKVTGDPGDPTATGPLCATDFDGGNPRTILKDGYLCVLDVSFDVVTKKAWVYVLRRQDNKPSVWRHCIDTPDKGELVWDGGVHRYFNVSANGQYAAAKVGNVNAILDLKEHTTRAFGEGCELSMAPDNTCRVLTALGGHNRVRVFDADGKSRVVPLNTMAPLNGSGDVGYVRWATHSRFITLRAPGSHHVPFAKDGSSDIYLGRFSEDFSSIERWVRVTCNGLRNSFSHAWIDPAGKVERPKPMTGTPAHAAPKDTAKAARVVIDGRLLTKSTTPSAKEAAPYERALSVYEYAVVKVIQGKCDTKTLCVAHWTLDKSGPLPMAVREIGKTYRLAVERYEDHQEIEADLLLDTIGHDAAQTLFYDVTQPLSVERARQSH